MAEVSGGGKSPLPSGYEYDFISAVLDDYHCVICHLPLREPVQTRCGHRFCKNCLDEAIRRYELSKTDQIWFFRILQARPIKRGALGGYPIPQYRKKKWQLPKYRVESRLNTDTAYFNHIPHTYGCFHHLARFFISGIYAPDVHVFFLIFW